MDRAQMVERVTTPREDNPALPPMLEGLTPDRAAAVTHGEGPLLIVAGAGTGKTTVITRRIATLIATKRVRPSEVLALTFTDKAAEEMEARVDLLIPYGFTNWFSACSMERLEHLSRGALGVMAVNPNAVHLGRQPGEIPPRPPLAKGGTGGFARTLLPLSNPM